MNAFLACQMLYDVILPICMENGFRIEGDIFKLVVLTYQTRWSAQIPIVHLFLS